MLNLGRPRANAVNTRTLHLFFFFLAEVEGVAQLAEHLSVFHEALGSDPSRK